MYLLESIRHCIKSLILAITELHKTPTFMKKQLLPALLLGLGLSGTIAAQNQEHPHRCSTSEYITEQLRLHPEYQQLIDNAETETQRNAPAGQPQAVITIPVVFHVVYQNATENINDTRLLEQLQVLNEDYSKTNADASSVPAAWQGIAANCEIQFCLAQRDANGNATTGIERTQTNVASFSFNDNVKSTSTGGANAWDRDKYLNIWVCDLGNQLLGYSSIVGGPANVDGVVLHYKYTGKTGATSPYNKGRTATHEVGHWLNLRHIWGDDGGACNGTDFVTDTPNQASENYGCFAVNNVQTDACTGAAPGIMWMNYMDYTDDACMYMFTAGQKTRMVNCLNNTRTALLTSNGCQPVGINELTLAAALNLFPSPTTGKLTVSFGALQVKQCDIMVYNMLGEEVIRQHYDALTENEVRLDLTGRASGVYFVEVRQGNLRVTRKIMLD